MTGSIYCSNLSPEIPLEQGFVCFCVRELNSITRLGVMVVHITILATRLSSLGASAGTVITVSPLARDRFTPWSFVQFTVSVGRRSSGPVILLEAFRMTGPPPLPKVPNPNNTLRNNRAQSAVSSRD